MALLLHIPLVAGAALLVAGLVPWLRARLGGRAGPPVLQPWHDGRRLLRKQATRPEGASALVAAGPVLCLAATGAAAMLVPGFSLGLATAPVADLLVIAGLLAAARAALVLAALDGGTAPGGLSAIGMLRQGALAEPALLVAALVLALLTGGTNLPAALLVLRDAAIPGTPLLLAVAGLAVIAVAGDFDRGGAPAASGWHGAALDAAGALRRVVWLSLAAGFLLPASLALPGFDALGWLAGLLAWAVKLAGLAALCAVASPLVERVGRAPVLGVALLMMMLGVLFLLAGGELA